MNQLSTLISAFFMLTAATPAVDQTGDAATVANFLDAIKREDTRAAQSFLAANIYVGDYTRTRQTSLDAFYAYARECRLKTIQLVATDTRLPVGVTWTCPFLAKDREASFWFDGSKINRIGWGPPLVINVPSPSARPRPIPPQ